MKKVVIINGSPRKLGNSALLADALKHGIAEALPDETQVDTFSPSTHEIVPCIGCERCCKTGECVHNDDMDALVDALEIADALIWISPLYFGTVSAQLKAIIDRFQLIWSRNVLAGEEGGIRSNRIRPASAFYVSAKDDPFVTEVKRTAALLPLRYASNTAGFTLGKDSCFAIVGPHKPGDIESAEFEAVIDSAAALIAGKV